MKSPEAGSHPEQAPNAPMRADDSLFRAKVQEALDDPRPAQANEEVAGHFAKRRAAALAALDPAAAGVDQEGQVKLGSLLAAVGRQASLSDEEVAAFQEMRDMVPKRPVR